VSLNFKYIAEGYGLGDLVLTLHFVKDVDAVYRIAFVLRTLSKGPYIYEWALTGCAKAHSRRALVDLVNQYISIEGVDIHRNTEPIAQIKDLALKDEFPHAIMLYARLLIWRGENGQAARLLEQKILPYLQPVKNPPPLWEDIKLLDDFESPWRMYAIAVEKEQGLRGILNATRRAAVEFHDPLAMTDYAISALETDEPHRYVRIVHGRRCIGATPSSLLLPCQSLLPHLPRRIYNRSRERRQEEEGGLRCAPCLVETLRTYRKVG
jgi:hypothetical protein